MHSARAEAASVSQVQQRAVPQSTSRLFTRPQLVRNVQPDPNTCGPCVVAADPGEVHLVAAVDGVGESVFKYSKARYCHDIGAAQMRKRSPRLYEGLSWRARVARGWTRDTVVQAQTTKFRGVQVLHCQARAHSTQRIPQVHLAPGWGRKGITTGPSSITHSSSSPKCCWATAARSRTLPPEPPPIIHPHASAPPHLTRPAESQSMLRMPAGARRTPAGSRSKLWHAGSSYPCASVHHLGLAMYTA